MADIARGGLFTDGDWVESKDQDSKGDVRLTQLADIGVAEFRDRSDRWLRSDQASRLNCTYLRPNDLMIARMPDPLARACLAPQSIGAAVTVVDVAVLRIDRGDVLPSYAMWAINSPQFRALAVAHQSGTTRKRISRKNLARLTIPVPDVVEQRRIVDILEDHLSRLDAAANELSVSKRRLRALRERLVIDALTGAAQRGPRQSSSLPDVGAHDGLLPELPIGWRWSRLGEVADVVGGVTKDAKKQSDPSYIDVPYLRVANVQRGRLALDSITRIRVAPAKAAALRLRSGDVLLNEGGDRDKLARGWVWEEQIESCIHQNHVFRARVRDETVDPYFLSWTTNTVGGVWAERNGKQSVNLASISLSMIRKMPVIVPPPGISSQIVAHLHSSLAALDRLDTALDSATRRGSGLRRALLAAAFSGRLTGRTSDLDLAEEPADETAKSDSAAILA